MKSKLTLPDFICVGPGKTGTNALYHCLKEHPSICMAKRVKGTRFFDTFYGRGIEWYAGLFSYCCDGTVKGEITETYFYKEWVPERIHRHLPDVKIIIILRNPIERAYRVFLQLCRLGMMSGSFDNAVRKYSNLISDNLYHTHLMRYLRYFPTENVLVTLYDDLQEDQAAFMRNIYTFVGVDPTFEPKFLGVRFNPSSLPRFKIINRAAFCAAWLLRFLDMRSLFEKAKQSEFIRRLLFKKPRDDDFLKMSDESRKYLQEAFREEIAKLSAHLGRNLDSWK